MIRIWNLNKKIYLVFYTLVSVEKLSKLPERRLIKRMLGMKEREMAQLKFKKKTRIWTIIITISYGGVYQQIGDQNVEEGGEGWREEEEELGEHGGSPSSAQRRCGGRSWGSRVRGRSCTNTEGGLWLVEGTLHRGLRGASKAYLGKRAITVCKLWLRWCK